MCSLKRKTAVSWLPVLIFLLEWYPASGRSISGITINEKNKLPVAFVNIGVPGKNVGTVSDVNGRFTLLTDSVSATDTLLFSCIGFVAFSTKISDLKENDNVVSLRENVYDINEVVVKPKIFKTRILGITADSRRVSAGFRDNLLGYELGTFIKVKKSAVIKKVNINIAGCSYDTVFYRLNIYRAKGKQDFENILKNPIYLNLLKDEVEEKIVLDLESDDIVVDGDFLITLEHIKDLGPGYLNFCAALFNNTYYRKTSQGTWQTVPVGISISVEADVEK